MIRFAEKEDIGQILSTMEEKFSGLFLDGAVCYMLERRCI
jgi:hypothetical protein